MKQRLDDLDRWAMSPQSGRVAALGVAVFAVVLLALVVIAGIPPSLLVLPTSGFVITMAMAYRRNRRAS